MGCDAWRCVAMRGVESCGVAARDGEEDIVTVVVVVVVEVVVVADPRRMEGRAGI